MLFQNSVFPWPIPIKGSASPPPAYRGQMEEILKTSPKICQKYTKMGSKGIFEKFSFFIKSYLYVKKNSDFTYKNEYFSKIPFDPILVYFWRIFVEVFRISSI